MKTKMSQLTEADIEKIHKDIIEYLRPESKLKANEVCKKNNIAPYIFNFHLGKIITKEINERI